jgi:hypothetical protein
MYVLKLNHSGSVMKRFVILFLAGLMAAYPLSCSLVSKRNSRAFESVSLGDDRHAVVQALGTPNASEPPEKLFTRYASRPCGVNCKERLWFENRLSFGTEAWSVELGEDGKVVHKAHWHSP